MKDFGFENTSWVDVIKVMNALVLFGSGFGELIKPKDSKGPCSPSRSVLVAMNYLAALGCDLKQILKDCGNESGNVWRVGGGVVCWDTPSYIFNTCLSTHDKFDRILLPKIASHKNYRFSEAQ